MAELNIFHYNPGKSVLHCMDTRFKLICMLLFTTASLFARLPGFIIITIIIITALYAANLPLMRMLKEIRGFSIILLIIILTRSCSLPGTPIPGISIPGVTKEGLLSGLFFAWKLFLILILGTILTGTTSVSQLRSALEWFFRRIPFIPASRIAIMISLTVTLVPLIFDQLSEIMNAQKARCIEGRKNPLKRITFLIFPLLSRTFMRAEEIALAMESRCYSEDRTEIIFSPSSKDWYLLSFSGVGCAVVFFL